MVTVVIPSYNRRASTARAVASVLAQTYRAFEVVVVDDASSEGNVYEPEPAFTSRVRVVRRAVNGGAAAARNTGVAEARGPLVAFLDSDDVWLPERLERHVALFSAQPNPSNVLVYSAYYTCDGTFSTKTPFGPIRPDQRLGDYLVFDYGCLHVNTWLAMKHLLARFPFDTELKQSEDWDAALRMEQAGVRFVYSAAPAAVRNVDLREDRLTTKTDVAVQMRFLRKNAERLSTEASLVFESIVAGASLPRSWRDKVQFLLATPRLSRKRRIALVVRYLTARGRSTLRKRRNRKRQAFGSS